MSFNQTSVAQEQEHNKVFDTLNGIDPERAAMLLALTRNREEEEKVKKILAKIQGMRFAVTEIGGISDALRTKIAPRVIGACLKQGVICRCSSQTHALLHAILEAGQGIFLEMPMSTSMSLKIGVVNHKRWIAVAIFGDSAIHRLTNHRRAGLGVMHVDEISDIPNTQQENVGTM